VPIVVLAAYCCEVAGKVTDSVDYQVRYFDSNSLEDVVSRLRSEKPHTYRNVYDQEVRWFFHDTVAVNFEPQLRDGAELIGFITGNTNRTTERNGAPNHRPTRQPKNRTLRNAGGR
jgi:hypothetical protein